MTHSPLIVHPVILCGGSGTRLWPLSRKSFPKQFVPLIGEKSLLQLTCERAKAINPELLVVAAEAHRFLVQECADAAGVRVRQILEPVARNTAAAMSLAALDADPEDLLLFLPADHHIPDTGAFAELAQRGAAIAAKGWIVTFGVAPTGPNTAYGYIRLGASLSEGPKAHEVEAFIEKPNPEQAAKMVLSGDHLWNAGVFLCQAKVLLANLDAHAADILAACRKAMATQTTDGDFTRLDEAAFEACRSESIDYAVMEKAERIAVLPFAGRWSDVGGWNAVAEMTPVDADDNRIDGDARVMNCTNTYLRAQHRLVVALGVSDLIIVDTPDALLVAAKDNAGQVKEVVADLEREGVAQATQHRRDARPWGAFDVIDVGDRFQVKRITVKPGGRLSLQSHHHRAEHWIVVKGTAKVTKGSETFLLAENQSTYIPLGETHSLENPGKVPLEMIEVQSGEYLGEDDIVRYEDSYGRA
jgi:mannose-1-phosphate guanylyltransferase/mannose-6-phosphate isomerase